MYTYSFEKLDVWKNSMELSVSVYDVSKIFPSSEQFGLTAQIRRSSVSVCSNIAEGSSRKSANDQGRFSTIAFGSLMETLTQLILAKSLNYIDGNQLVELRTKIDSIAGPLSKLRDYQQSRLPSK